MNATPQQWHFLAIAVALLLVGTSTICVLSFHTPTFRYSTKLNKNVYTFNEMMHPRRRLQQQCEAANPNNNVYDAPSIMKRLFSSVMQSANDNNLLDKFFFSKQQLPTELKKKKKKKEIGSVLRTAARSYKANGSSRPASPTYTTNKPSKPEITITHDGVVGDYNDYRTRALKSTPNRAISILTQDVMDAITSTFRSGMQAGDLGENILVNGLLHTSFRVGDRFTFLPPARTNEQDNNNNNNNDKQQQQQQGNGGGAVVVEITEPIEPCSNLCKLPYINRDEWKPSRRVQECKNFLQYLDQRDGFRGWYAKVVTGGTIRVGFDMKKLV